MKPSRLKVLGWGLLCLGVPNIVFNTAVLQMTIMSDAPENVRSPYFYSAVIFSLVTCVGLAVLWYAFLKEPRRKDRPLQLRLMDLVVLSLFTGCMLLLTPYEWLHWALLLYIPAIALALLLTAYRNLPTVGHRFLYGLGTAAWWCGCMSLGFWISFLLESLSSAFGNEPPGKIIQELYNVGFVNSTETPPVGVDYIVLVLVRSIILLPIGLALCALIRALSPKTSYKEPA